MVLSAVRIFLSLTTVTVTRAWIFFPWVFSFESLDRTGPDRIVKNCDLGLKNSALVLRPRAAFSRPRSQFFTIRTSQPANNIYICHQSHVTTEYHEKHARSYWAISHLLPVMLAENGELSVHNNQTGASGSQPGDICPAEMVHPAEAGLSSSQRL